METLVVGAGEMGRWFASTTTWPVTFTDIDAAAAATAAEATDSQTVPIDSTETFDLVCIAVPIPAVEDALNAHAPKATRAVIDVTGVMEPALAAMDDYAPDVAYASLHPLFSASNAPGNVPITIGRDGSAIDAVRTALADAGNNVFECTAAEHDKAMRTIQSATHAAVLAYGLAAEPVPERFQTGVSADLDALVEQVTSGDARVYADIQDAFDGADRVAEAAEAVASADHDAFTTLYEQAAPSTDTDH